METDLRKRKDRAPTPAADGARRSLRVAADALLEDVLRRSVLDDLVRNMRDDRRFSFDTFDRPAAVVRRASRLDVVETPRKSVPAGVRFSMPDLVSVCVRRKVRREAIFAGGHGGGGRRRARPKRGPYSGVKC